MSTSAFSYGKRVPAEYNTKKVMIVIDTPDVIDSIRFQTDMTRMRAIEAAADAASKIHDAAVKRLTPTVMVDVAVPDVPEGEEAAADSVETQEGAPIQVPGTKTKIVQVEMPEPITDLALLQATVAEMDEASAFAESCMARREVEFANLVSRVARYVTGFEQEDGSPILFREGADEPKSWMDLTQDSRRKYARQLFNLFLGPVLSSLGSGAELSELKK